VLATFGWNDHHRAFGIDDRPGTHHSGTDHAGTGYLPSHNRRSYV
jgi:hypothetical protein